MSHAQVEHMDGEDMGGMGVSIMRLSYREYPYDHFLLYVLPGGQMMIHREESQGNFIVWQGPTPYECLQSFLFAKIDEVCGDKLCRVPARGEEGNGKAVS